MYFSQNQSWEYDHRPQSLSPKEISLTIRSEHEQSGYCEALDIVRALPADMKVLLGRAGTRWGRTARGHLDNLELESLLRLMLFLQEHFNRVLVLFSWGPN